MKHPLNIVEIEARAAVMSKLTSAYTHRLGTKVMDRHLEKALNHEAKRLIKEDTHESKAKAESYQTFIERIKEASGSAERQREALLFLAQEYVHEIKGSFRPWVYSFASTFLPMATALWFHPFNPRRLLLDRNFRSLRNNLFISGPVDKIRRLQQKGTIVYVPTHLSNFDSILIGLALLLAKLEPVSYGAGINLFFNPVLSFFMNKLGAYKIDRSRKSRIYIDTLKSYSEFLLEKGIHSLFFPGGTRDRSGMGESRLKLGLLATSITSLYNNLNEGRPRPSIYIVPCTISYQLVLEASTLIDEHLKTEDQQRIMITDDEFSQWARMKTFLTNFFILNDQMYFRFGEPMDPFGNRINDEGNSVDDDNNTIDLETYFEGEGGLTLGYDRNQQYVNSLGAHIIDSFSRNQVITSTSILARVVFMHLQAAVGSGVLQDVLTCNPRVYTFLKTTIYRDFIRLYRRLSSMEKSGELVLPDDLSAGNVRDVFLKACQILSSYHIKKPIRDLGDRIVPNNPKLLLYYQNKLERYQIGAEKPQLKVISDKNIG